METKNSFVRNSLAMIIAIIGIAITCVGTGITLLFVTDLKAKIIGIILIFISVSLPLLTLIYYKIKAMSVEGLKMAEDIGNVIKGYSNNLEELVKKIGLANDARFVPDGFIGLQRQAIAIESNFEIGPTYVRMAILGHLPSYMRLHPISEERGKALYRNWEPPHYIPEYIKLVNQRSEAFKSFIEKGGIVRDIFEKPALVDYASKGFTFHDEIIDPTDEIEERLNALLFYLDKPNYYLCLLEKEHSGPHYLLKLNVGLVIDLRTTETDRHFTHSIDGLYTESKPILKEFERKFTLTWKQSEKEATKTFIRNLLRQLRDSPKKDTNLNKRT